MKVDVAIVGGGPAGLAVAIEARSRGFSAVVLERRSGELDKACGEGLLPSGVAGLARLGALRHLEARDSAPIESIAWVQEDGRSVLGRLPAPGGLGVRRVALWRALAARAAEAGVVVRQECAVLSHARDSQGISLATDAGEIRAELLVAADGLHSPLRKAEGLEVATRAPRRFGLRRHVAMAPWSRSVEVHFAPGAEAYVTPAGASRVGIAILFEPAADAEDASFEAFLARFPALAARVRGAAPDSTARGAGPLRQDVRARVKDRFVLVGDAAGSVDAITGEGLSLAFAQAAALGRVLPAALAQGASAVSLAPYEREAARAFAAYARLAGGLLGVARRPWLRRFVVDRLIANPRLFGWSLAAALRADQAPPDPDSDSSTPKNVTRKPT